MKTKKTSKVINYITITYKDGDKKIINDPYAVSHLQCFESCVTYDELQEINKFMNQEDAEKSVERIDSKSCSYENIKQQVLNIFKDIIMDQLAQQATCKEALALDQTNCQENINDSFEGETWNGAEVPF
jgi:hypothetical protein